MIQVLIVEDDAGIAEIHRQYLQRVSDFDVSGIALSIADAMIHINAKPPQLLLLDVYMPDGTGLELLKYIRSQDLAIDVMLLTAAKEASTLQEALRNGVFDYILKPVVFPRLQESLNNYKNYLRRLDQNSSFEQQDVDKLMPMSEGATAESKKRLPKGVDAVTLDKVRGLFTEHPALTAELAGKEIGSSRTTARRYLEYLVSCNELSPEVAYGAVGRPERVYHRLK
ncbi:transcriptional regulatory protein [Agarivorans sp. Toyoura001]|uniref:response regulator n=1 Tax=Agarivorans sp. Toyoura001 TaxID=2283141 RepID=UPI0010DC8C84|nr:response regulator [Agarivorans sp. Toyoura001]GDY24857.1 transcriptional regulatory protein [Agarivorans sp. Toyoura001]